MELVEGETLAQRLTRGPISLDEALPIAKQICDALEAAHEKGIVHRDLKPGNVMVLGDGRAKVLDSVSRTGGGVLIGTAAYMIPEQARGREANRATDTSAFGCVLYEMLSGRQAFGGETMTDILGSIVKGEPDWNALPKGVPARLVLVDSALLAKERQGTPAQRRRRANPARRSSS